MVHQSARPSEAGAIDAIVVGAGQVGSACALALGQSGLRVALVERAQSSSSLSAAEPWDRRVYALGPGTREFLRELKVWDKLDQARIAPVRDMRVFANAERRSELHFGAYEASCEALAWIVEHRELTRVLDAAIGFQSRVERVTTEMVSLLADPRRVELRSEGRVLSAQLVVGADGAQSRVREAAGLRAHSQSYGQMGVVANFSVSRPHGGVAHQWFVDGGIIALLPLPGDASSLVWSAPDELAQTLQAEGPELIAARLAPIVGEIFPDLRPLGGVSAFPLNRLTTDHLIGERVALIGDAAHVVHPLAGQGLNLGLADARVLAQVIGARETHRDPGDRALLRRFERARAEDVWAMGLATDGLYRLFASHDPLLRQLRTIGLGFVGQVPPLKSFFARRAMA